MSDNTRSPDLSTAPDEGRQQSAAKSLDGRSRLCLVYRVRYVPNLVGREFINIGLLVYEPERRVLMSRFNFDVKSLMEFHPFADEEFLKDLAGDFDRRIMLYRTNPERLLDEVKSYSNLIQIDEPIVCWLEDPKVQVQRFL